MGRLKPDLKAVLSSVEARDPKGFVLAESEDAQCFRDHVERPPDHDLRDGLAATEIDYAAQWRTLMELKATADRWVNGLVREMSPKISELSEGPSSSPLDEQVAALRQGISGLHTVDAGLAKQLDRLAAETAKLSKSTAGFFAARHIRDLTLEVSRLSPVVKALVIIDRTHPVILKALSADQQLQLLAALTAGREPDVELPDSHRRALVKLYGATSLSSELLDSQRRLRRDVIRDLMRDPVTVSRLRRARDEWPNLGKEERIAVLRLISDAHCARAGIQVPTKIRLEARKSAELGAWFPDRREIVVNSASSEFDDFAAMAGTVFHENTHNYQWAVSAHRGLKDAHPTDWPAKLAAQIRLFRANFRRYVSDSEHGYAQQPVEAHAHLVGRQFAHELSHALLKQTGEA